VRSGGTLAQSPAKVYRVSQCAHPWRCCRRGRIRFLEIHHRPGSYLPTYRDPASKDRGSPIALSYGTSMIPEAYIIDRHGKIARKVIGPQEWDSPDMRAYFDALLAQN